MAAEVQRIGPVEVLVNCAGVMSDRMSKTLRASPEEWRRVMDVNLFGAVHTVGQLGPAMAERRRGRVINVSACMGRFTGPGLAGGLAPYRVSKTALNAFTRNFAAETGFGRRGLPGRRHVPGPLPHRHGWPGRAAGRRRRGPTPSCGSRRGTPTVRRPDCCGRTGTGSVVSAQRPVSRPSTVATTSPPREGR